MKLTIRNLLRHPEKYTYVGLTILIYTVVVSIAQFTGALEQIFRFIGLSRPQATQVCDNNHLALPGGTGWIHIATVQPYYLNKCLFHNGPYAKIESDNNKYNDPEFGFNLCRNEINFLKTEQLITLTAPRQVYIMDFLESGITKSLIFPLEEGRKISPEDYTNVILNKDETVFVREFRILENPANYFSIWARIELTPNKVN